MCAKKLFETIEDNMNTAIDHLNGPAMMNTSRGLQRIFFDPDAGVALAGYRKNVANIGSLLMRASYPLDNEVSYGELWSERYKEPCYYDFMEEEFFNEDPELLGKEVRDDEYEIVDTPVANGYFNKVLDAVEGHHEWVFDPFPILEQLKEIIDSKRGEIRNHKINLQFTAGIPKGEVPATPMFNEAGEVEMVATVNGKLRPAKIDWQMSAPDPKTLEREAFYADEAGMKYARKYLCRPISRDDDGNLQVQVSRPHKLGVRLAVQEIELGVLNHDSPGYEVVRRGNNGIRRQDQFETDYEEEQSLYALRNAPMMTFDLDMFESMLSGFYYHQRVHMKFKDHSQGVYFYAAGDGETIPDLDAILSPTISYVRGRTCIY